MLYEEQGLLYLPAGSILNNKLQLYNGTHMTYKLEKNIIFIYERRTPMAKLDRNRGMFFASFDDSTWEVLGKDNDDLSKELNPDTEISKNVLGETTFKHSGYQPEVSLDPYYANETSVLYDDLLAAAVQEKYSDDDILGYFVEVVFATVNPTEGTMTGTGYKRDAYIVPQSIGGDTSGLSIPFTVNPIGAMTAVTVTYTIATRAVTIEPVSP